MTLDSKKIEANSISEELVSGVSSIIGVVRLLVNNPDSVKVNVIPSEHSITVELHTDPADVGQVLGKSGHLMDSIRSILSAFAGKNRLQVHFDYITEIKGRGRFKGQR